MARRKIKTVEVEIMREVAQELDLPFSVVKDMIMNGQSAFTAYVMKTSSFASVKWPRLGKFEVKLWKMVVGNYRKGMNKMQRDLFWYQIQRGEVLTNVPRWAIEQSKLSERQKELLKKYGDAVIEN